MTFKMPVNRTQMWLARGTILVCIVMVIILRTVDSTSVSSVRDGDTTVYSDSALGSVYFGVAGIVTAVMGIVFWMQRSALYRLFSVCLFPMAIFMFLNVPTGLNHCVIVTPDDFYHRVGAWYAPEETKVSFDSLKYMVVNLKETDRSGNRNYELLCVTREGDETIRIPVHVLMNKALREILERAAQRGVFIDENEEGWQIPPDISQ